MMNEKKDVMSERRRGGLRKIAGVLVAVLGLFWLAHKAGWMTAEHGHSAIVWPIIVIASGLFLFFSDRHKHAD
jgi:hypothetical protein